MWDKLKHDRFQELRSLESEGRLTVDEIAELASLTTELEAIEASYLGSATEKLGQENEELRTQNSALTDIVARRQRLIERLRAVLQESALENQNIEAELSKILAASTDRIATH